MFREAVDAIHHKIIYPYLTSGEAQDDREIAHERALALMERQIENNPIFLWAMDSFFTLDDPILAVTVFGQKFRNPLGVAAGFDKNGRVYKSLAALGFSFVEIGSITTIPYKGNDRPRIFALPEDNALINRMGFPGEGLSECDARLAKKFVSSARRKFRLGISIGASRPSFEKGTVIDDFQKAHKYLGGYGDFVVDNISSPNTLGVRALQEVQALDELLSATDFFHPKDPRFRKPRLVKLSPDVSFAQLDLVLDIISHHNVDGVVLTNTTTNPQIRSDLKGQLKQQTGGISGSPLSRKALSVSRFIYEQTEGKLPIIRAGGIMTSKDYWEAVVYGGASLVQVYTAFVNHRTSTPNLAYYFNRDLAQSMKIAGVKNLEELRFSKLAYPSGLHLGGV